VKCNKSISSSVSVTSGAPEGSVIGPLIFVLFINDLPVICPPCSIKLYADDVKLYFPIKKPSDRIALQCCLDKVYNWAMSWELRFSFSKCQFLQIGYSNPTVFYHLGNHVIQPSNTVSDLGVNVHSNLKPSLHCSTIVSKANIRAKLILKCFLSNNHNNFIRAFKCYVRPLLEYSSVVWNPWLLQDINLVESVQRIFTRKVCILCHLPKMSYEERLIYFNLDKLELRRLRADLVEMFKIINGFSACNVKNVLNFSNVNVYHNTRGHRFKLALTRTNKNAFKYCFINRVIDAWNFLPDNCFNTNLISTFRNRLTKINLNRFISDQL
jgi:hypothetical protein